VTRVRAPELRGRGWLNTGGRDLRLADLRGRFVLLDFWTFCCINCLHVLDELRPLEHRYADVLVVVGVHSPKFEHEKDPRALADAVRRYGVAHPVLDDPDLATWEQYAARAWPTLNLIDPEGYVVATMSGEGHAESLAALLDELIERYTASGTLLRGEGPFVPPAEPETVLSFPGKAIAYGDGILVSSSAQHQIVEMEPDAATVRRRIGSGERGRTDGPAGTASFNEPQGLCLLPSTVADRVGYQLVVADTVNHLLRGVRLSDGAVSTVAGTGQPWRREPEGDTHDARSVDLSSPWDLAWYQDRIVIAMAGVHQLWWFDPVSGTAGVFAGTTVEALRDGPVGQAWLAQPSGLSVAGDRLWFVDSESSALRYVEDGRVHTVVGQGLFDFGLVDGAAGEALLQHPLGVLAQPDGPVLVADTYNGAVRRYADGQLSTVELGLAEPSDLLRAPDGGTLVVESAAHRLVPLAQSSVDSATPATSTTATSTPATSTPATSTPAARMRTKRPPAVLSPGAVTLEVVFVPPNGEKLDDSFGPATRLDVSASPPELLIEGAGSGTEFTRALVLADGVPEGVLQVTAQAATCDTDAEHPVCRLARQDWGIPVRLAADGARHLPLMLHSVPEHGTPPAEPG
jgi:thiol-disulfide isomerase/thioredoxin